MASTVRLVHVFARIAPLGHFLNSPTILAVIVQMASGAALARLSALSASLVAFGRTSQVALVVHQALAAVRQQLNVMSAQQDGSQAAQSRQGFNTVTIVFEGTIQELLYQKVFQDCCFGIQGQFQLGAAGKGVFDCRTGRGRCVSGLEMFGLWKYSS